MAVYVKVDEQIWNQLNKFLSCVRYIEEEMTRDVCKLYIGANMMLDISKCEKELKNVETKIINYIKENYSCIDEYNNKLKELEELENLWKNYLSEVKETIKNKI